jgi:hypothetical protein
MRMRRAYSGPLSVKLVVQGSAPLSIVMQTLLKYTIRFEVAPTNLSQVYEVRHQPAWCQGNLSRIWAVLGISETAK